MAKRAVFFDRDGTLTQDHGYTFRTADLVWLPGAIDAILAARRAGFRVIVATNQSGIARGLFTEADMHAFHGAMQSALAAQNAAIDAFYFCPFHETALDLRYRVADHPDRKPNPGMLLRAIQDFALEARLCVMVGDQQSDVIAGQRAGMAGLLADGRPLNEVIGAFLDNAPD